MNSITTRLICKRFCLSIFLTIVTFSSLPSVGDQNALFSCKEAFHLIQQHMVDIGTTYREDHADAGTTLEIDVDLGDQLVLKKKDASPWGSIFDTMGHDPQGNPKWILVILGREVAKVLGLEEKGNNGLITPRAKRVNEGIKQINKRLIAKGLSPISLTFYDQVPSKSSLKNYLSAWNSKNQLPLADPKINLNHYLHDISYHLASALLIPKEWIDRRSEINLEFETYFATLTSKYIHTEAEFQISKIISAIRLALVVDIDSLTAIPGVAAVDSATFARSDHVKESVRLSQQLTSVRPIVLSLERAINSLYGGGPTIIDETIDEQFATASAILNTDTFLILENQIKQGVRQIWEKLAKTAINFNGLQSCKYLNERRLQIFEAALELVPVPAVSDH